MPAFTSLITKQWIMRGVTVPPAVVKELGGWQTMGKRGKGIPVIARYGGEVFSTTVTPGGGAKGWLTVRMEALRPLKLDAGDRLEVDLTLSTEPREPIVPEDLKRALQNRPMAKAYFDSVTPASRRYVVRALDECKRPETRQNRIEYFVERFAEHGRDRAAAKSSGPGEAKPSVPKKSKATTRRSPA
ncbi:MAG: YdeI/OmpD-associated family protein [Opitutaceae bacterium]